MNRIEHYHDWLRDAHAMEKQAESMLESMASRIDNYPELRARIEQHLSETKNQIVQLETILDRNDISRSVIKDSMSKMAALGQSIGGIIEAILNEEKQMADWLIQHIPQTTEKFLIRSETDGVEAKK